MIILQGRQNKNNSNEHIVLFITSNRNVFVILKVQMRILDFIGACRKSNFSPVLK